MRRSLASLLRRLADRLDPVPPAPLFYPTVYTSSGQGSFTVTYGDPN